MKTLCALLLLLAVCWTGAAAHGGGASVTWNREVSRLVYDKCASCHRPGGTAFSLMTYLDAQPRANEIKDAVLSRRMPPWGAIKGFGTFRNDQSLTQDQIELIRRWVDGGIRRGNNPRMLPKVPEFTEATSPVRRPARRIAGVVTLLNPLILDGLIPEKVAPGRSLRIVAMLPDGRVEPLVWLHDYDTRYAHAFLLRKPLHLPAGTTIGGVPSDSVIDLLQDPNDLGLPGSSDIPGSF
ncbi:MAG: hypothetical protein GEU82_08755 [Luteitalea sp.]|nr:hypothetical protein [Luteitalea sp.]